MSAPMTQRNMLPVPASVAFPAPCDIQRLMDAFEEVCEFNSMAYVEAAGARAYRGKMPTVSDVRAGVAPKGEPLTFFQSTRLPKLTLFNLGRALRNNFDTTHGLVAAAVVNMIRFCETSGFRPTLHSMHRLFVGTLPLTIKAHCDMFMRNSDAARLCGVVVEEINRLEAAICDGVNWKLIVQSEELADIDSLLVRLRKLAFPVPQPVAVAAPPSPSATSVMASSVMEEKPSPVTRGASPAKSAIGESPSDDYAPVNAGEISPSVSSSNTPPRSVRHQHLLLRHSASQDEAMYWAAHTQGMHSL